MHPILDPSMCDASSSPVNGPLDPARVVGLDELGADREAEASARTFSRGDGMGVRRTAREAALQALFMCDALEEMDGSTVRLFFDHFATEPSLRPYASKLCDGVLEHLPRLNERITCASENWNLSRMGRVERTILRIASFEILFLDEIPISVAINEAIEIARCYGSEESPQFVNGVLDRVASTARVRERGPCRAGESGAGT
jgi:N utilization substance protein B